MSGTRTGALRRHRQESRNLRASYWEDVKKSPLVWPVWSAYRTHAAAEIGDFAFVDDEPFVVSRLVGAHSLTQTPPGDPFGIAALDIVCDRSLQRTEIERPKLKARQAVKRALNRGHLTRQPCEVCGAVFGEAHHDDYDRPLEVRWLCRLHHEAVHHGEQVAA